MAKRKKKEITCSVTITEGASERKRNEEMRGITKDETA